MLQPTAEDVFIGTPPLAFTFGLGGLVVFPLRVGACSLLIEKATPDELADLIAEHRRDGLLHGTDRLPGDAASGKAASSRTLRRAVSAGEHLPASAWHAFQEATGIKIIDGIGATEMLHIFISAADDDIRPGSTGRAVPGYVATVLDDDGRPVPAGEIGRLAVKGPTGCRYLADPRQGVYVQNGWNITGDTFLPGRGRLLLVPGPQRRHDHLVRLQHRRPGGRRGAAHPPRGRRVRASSGCPTPTAVRSSRRTSCCAAGVDGDDAKRKELQDFVKQQIAPYKYPRVVEFVEALPRTSTGKVQRFRLREPD